MNLKTPQWYVVQVISWTEENVKSSLLQRRESFWLENYILDIFVPTHDVVSLRAWWVKVKRKKNIFPWYILVEMIATNESWYIVRNTPNVTWFLWAWTVPVPITPKELEQLKWMLEKNTQTFETKYKIWDEATITKWPFEWNIWIISEINDKKWYIKLNINLLWRDTPVELDFSQIKINK